jgi:hypothetical protein
MRIKAHMTNDLNEQLRQHPAIKRILSAPAQAGEESTVASASDLRRIVRGAMVSDPRIGSLVNRAHRVAQCRDEGRALLRRTLQGERVGERAALSFSRKWAGIEHDYHSMVDLSYELITSNKTIAAYAQAAKDIDDVHRFANPAFLDKSQRLLLGELGADVDDLMEAYRYAYLPDRTRMDQAIASIDDEIPTEGRKHVDKMVFLYAPERMLERGVITLAGGIDPVTVAIIFGSITATLALLSYLEEVKQTVLATKTANWMVFLVLWFIWNDLQNKVTQAQTQLAQLQQQYDDEVRLLEAEHATATVGDTPAVVAKEFGYVVGNMSRSKLEVHLPNCNFLHLIRPDHLKTLDTLANARAAGLDNCHYCIGDSTR